MQDEDFCCTVCLDFFIDPHIISCGHSYCRLCIESHLNINEKCPLCRSPTGIPIRNRQLESLTMSYVASRNLSSEYYERMTSYKKKLILQNRALVIIWTQLNKHPGQLTEVRSLVTNVEDEELRSEILCQVRRQLGVALEHAGDPHGEPVAVRWASTMLS